MVVAMEQWATEEQISAIIARLQDHKLDVHRSTGASRTVIGAIGDTHMLDLQAFEVMPGVAEVVRISEPYKLASRTFKRDDSLIHVGDVAIGGNEVILMAGPCSVESLDQMQRVAERVAKAGAKILRGGAYKPRTSPYSFPGMGEEGLEILRKAADEFSLKVVTEAMDRSHIKPVVAYADMLQVGARNMQNFTFLRDLGKTHIPIVLKRGLSATYEEWLMSAEYIMAGGNHNVVLCERGIRTFETYTRNTLDIAAIPVIKKLSHLPIVVDPSHGTGRRDKVLPMARAAVAAGADGLLIEVHHDPDHALSDGVQTLAPDQFDELMGQLRQIIPVLGRTIS
jgi:3-deoxy-7-phosphoheptulonate synthase